MNPPDFTPEKPPARRDPTIPFRKCGSVVPPFPPLDLVPSADPPSPNAARTDFIRHCAANSISTSVQVTACVCAVGTPLTRMINGTLVIPIRIARYIPDLNIGNVIEQRIRIVEQRPSAGDAPSRAAPD